MTLNRLAVEYTLYVGIITYIAAQSPRVLLFLFFCYHPLLLIRSAIHQNICIYNCSNNTNNNVNKEYSVERISISIFMERIQDCINGNGEAGTICELIREGLTQIRIIRGDYAPRIILNEILFVDLTDEPPFYGEFQLV